VRIEDLTDEDIGRWVIYTAPHGKQEIGRIKSWNEQFIFVVYNCAGEWAEFDNYTAAATKPDDLTVFLSTDILVALPKRTIFATGILPDSPAGLFMTGTGKALRWVAETGEIHDWAVYCHWADNSIEWVRRHGDKVCRKEHIQRCVFFQDKSVFSMYRY
jgi:hypothetical protein